MSLLLNENLITTRQASELSGYRPDYLGRLCREGKLSGKQIGRVWIVDRTSLDTFIREQELAKKKNAVELARSREKEYQDYQEARKAAAAETPQEAAEAPEEKLATIVEPVRSPYVLVPTLYPELHPVRNSAVAALVTVLVVGMGVYGANAGVIDKVAAGFVHIVGNVSEIGYRGAASAALSVVEFETALGDRILSAATAVSAGSARGGDAAIGLASATGSRLRHVSAENVSSTIYDAQLSLGMAVVGTSDSILRAHKRATDLWVEGSPAVAERVVTAFYGTGTQIVARTVAAPRSLARVYDSAVLAWVEGTPLVAERFVRTQVAFGAGIIGIPDADVVRDARHGLARALDTRVVESSPRSALAAVPQQDTLGPARALALFTYEWLNGLFDDAGRSFAALFAPVTQVIVHAPGSPVPAQPSAVQSVIDVSRVVNQITNTFTTSPVTYVYSGVTKEYVREAIDNLRDDLRERDRDNDDDSSGSGLADLSGSSIEDLGDVAAMTKIWGDLLFWNGAEWANLATSSLGISGSGIPGGAPGNVQYNAGGNFGGDATFTFDAAAQRLSFTYGSSTAFSASYGGFSLLTATTAVIDTLTTAVATLGNFTADNGTTTNATSTNLTALNSFALGADRITDITGPGLTTTTGALAVDDVAPSMLQAADFGDFSCNGTSCSFDADTISDSELDYGTVTLGDFTNDAGFITGIGAFSIEDLSDVAAITENYGDLLGWNGSAWSDFATSSLGLPTFADLAGYSTFGYPFPGNATSTAITFSGGLVSVGSTTVNGNATTTGQQGVGSLFINAERFTDLTGTGLQNVAGALTVDASGDWTGTFDGQEGSWYRDRANHTGTQLASTISNFNDAVNNFIHASTTIPKTYTTNTFTASQVLNGGLTLGTLNGPLQANNGVVSATTSIGVLYGGTGLTAAPSYGQLLLGNSSGGYTLTATSSLGLQAQLTGTQGQVAYFSGTDTAVGTSSLFITTNGMVGVGTTSPWGMFSIHHPATGGANPIFVIASSTATATTTLFEVDNDGATAIMSASSSGFAVGPNGRLNPLFLIDQSVANAVAGISIIGNSSGNSPVIAAISSAGAAGLVLRAKATTDAIVFQTGSGGTRLSIDGTRATFTPGASTAAGTTRFQFTGASDTTLTTATEATSVYFNIGQIRSHSSGAIATQRDFRITPTTHTFTAGTSIPNSLITNAMGVSIDGVPLVGAIGAFTNSHALYIGSNTANASTTNAYGLTVNASTGATNNYAAQFLGGNVGIGTTSPYARLSVVGQTVSEYFTATSTSASSTFPLLAASTAFSLASDYITDLTGNGLAIVNNALSVATSSLASGFFLQDGNSFGTLATLGTNDSNALAFETAGTERLRIDTSGNVGIGTSTMSASTKLHVYVGASGATAAAGINNVVIERNNNAGLSILTPDANTGTIALGSATDSTGGMVSWDFTTQLMRVGTSLSGAGLYFTTGNGAEVARFSSTGNLGIGTSTPAGKLDIVSDAAALNRLLVDLPTSGVSNRTLTISRPVQNAFGFQTSLSNTGTAFGDLVLQAAGGNVGIGTTTPVSKLQVTGTTANIPSSAILLEQFVIDDTDGGIGIYASEAGSIASRLTLGLVNGGALTNKWGLVRQTASGGNGLLFTFGTNADANANTANVYFDDGGNVGIGTTTPWGLLSINPNALGSGVPEFVIGSSTATHMIVTGAGNVGIGTAGPDSKLHLIGGLCIEDSDLGNCITSSYNANADNLVIGATTATNNGITILSGTANTGNILFNDAVDNSIRGGIIYDHATDALRLTSGGNSNRFIIDSSGNVSIGTSTSNAKLTVGGNGDGLKNFLALWGTQATTDGTATGISFYNTNANPSTQKEIAGIAAGRNSNNFGGSLNLFTSDTAGATSTRMFIDSSGRVMVGDTTARTYGSSIVPALQINGTGSSGLGVSRWANNAAGIGLSIAKSRGAVVGTRGVVASDDDLGFLLFDGDDGTNFIPAAQVLVEVDGTPGTNDMPGRLTFWTTADGASTLTERMRITSAGNVGIGTSTPQWTLNPFSATASQLSLSAGAGVAQWAFRNAGGNLYFATTTVAGTATSSPSAFTILGSSGFLGVGTANPQTMVDIRGGDMRISRTTSGTGDAALYFGGSMSNNYIYGGDLSNIMAFQVNGAERIRVTGTGNVGIGTTTPSTKLSVAGGTSDGIIQASTLSGNIASLQLDNYGTGGRSWSIRSLSNTIAPNGGLDFTDNTAGLQRMVITSAGNVGIGTTTPASSNGFATTLSIAGGAPSITLKGTLGNTLWEIGNDSGGNFRLIRDSAVSALTVNSSGNVGIGTTTPNARLQVLGATDIMHVAGTGNKGVMFNDNASLMELIGVNKELSVFNAINLRASGTSGTPQLSVAINGNVGIGTSTPWRKLSVTDTSAQFVTAYDTTRYTQFDTNAIGDLTISPQGGDISSLDTNLWICAGGACPSGGGGPPGFGYVIAETGISVASSTPWAGLSLASGKAIVVAENTLATSTSMTVDWRNGNQQLVRVGTAGTTISFSGYIEGQKLVLTVCNPGATAGAISWGTQILWPGGTAPTQTTTANKCDVWSFLATAATSTVKIFGSQSANF